MIKQLDLPIPNSLIFWENWLFIIVSEWEFLSSNLVFALPPI